MAITVRVSELREIVPLREKYRKEMDCQIIHDSIHARAGWTREFALHMHDGGVIGYGSVAVAGPWRDNPALYEFFVEPEHRIRTRLSRACCNRAGPRSSRPKATHAYCPSCFTCSLETYEPNQSCSRMVSKRHSARRALAFGRPRHLTPRSFDDSSWMRMQGGSLP